MIWYEIDMLRDEKSNGRVQSLPALQLVVIDHDRGRIPQPKAKVFPRLFQCCVQFLEALVLELFTLYLNVPGRLLFWTFS